MSETMKNLLFVLRLRCNHYRRKHNNPEILQMYNEAIEDYRQKLERIKQYEKV